ncbi:MAG: CDP-alcohol phosphatidyltransferase family protein [Sphaerochaetaceae bacterium]|jgi:cardiolipin synthase (CMP-forming)|nr:CDP-alcohol phosphatidyltransferase family protein [Sphaerochaetaceae bacterium]NLY07073.1 CDP-alcohol phosphatidyltransferase family protein [Spirochaetales bacterium]
MKKYPIKDWFSIPNIMGYFRILLIPVFVTLFLKARTSRDYFVCGIIIAVSYATDVLDGLIARRFNQITELGILIDPVADKLTQFAILFMLLLINLNLIPLFILFIVKEGFMGVMGLIMMRRGKKLQRAEWFGKLSTGVFDIGMIAILLFSKMMKPWMAPAILWTCGVFMGLSLILYIRLYSKMAREN